MTIISQFILHSSLAFHNKEHAIESPIAFYQNSCIYKPFRFDDRFEATVSSIEFTVSSQVLRLNSIPFYSILNTR